MPQSHSVSHMFKTFPAKISRNFVTSVPVALRSATRRATGTESGDEIYPGQAEGCGMAN